MPQENPTDHNYFSILEVALGSKQDITLPKTEIGYIQLLFDRSYITGDSKFDLTIFTNESESYYIHIGEDGEMTSFSSATNVNRNEIPINRNLIEMAITIIQNASSNTP
jgi:hypothetical protein